MADTSDVTLAFAADATPAAALAGAIPWQRINFVSHDFAPQGETTRSKIIRPDAANQEARRTSGGFSGTLAMELARDAELETLLSYALRGTWVTNVLKAGVAKNQVVFEEKVLEGAVASYFRHRGAVLSGFALEVSPDGMTDIRFPVTGTTIEDDGAIVATSTYAAAGTAPVLAGVDFTALTTTGWLEPLDVESISIDMTNNTRADRKLGSKDPRSVNWGKRDVTIEWNAYFRGREAFQKFKADPVTAISFGFTAPGATSGFDFQFDRTRITAYGKPITGENATIMVPMTAVATYDATQGTDFRITRRA